MQHPSNEISPQAVLGSLEAFIAASPPLSLQPMNSIVDSRLLPQIESLFDLLVNNGLDTELDGIYTFRQTAVDRFLPGKIAVGLSYLLINTSPEDPRFQKYVDGYRKIMAMTVDQPNDTWGVYYYISAIAKLKDAGLLDRAIAPETLEKLKKNLDWKVFVNTQDYTLINLPTNYYGVAFSIARLRYNMAWEDASGSEILLQKMIDHYKTFSDFGFSDETDGAGRFDRYSILLIGEIMQHLIETGMQPSAQDMQLLNRWLRGAVDLIKMQMNPAGNGIDFGRSLSSYSETAHSEVLSAAARLNVLTQEEKELAYAYATRITAKYVDFWLDPQMGSVNLWEKGRRTDDYRNKSRILGENFSLAHQLIYTNNLWKTDGFATRAPMPHAQFKAALDSMPAMLFTKFAGFDGKPTTYDRALLTYRDGARSFSLPIINGAKKYHDSNPYFPVPHSTNLLSGVANTKWPHLLARFTLEDGSVLVPVSFIKNIKVTASGHRVTVSYEMDAMNLSKGLEPVADTRLTSTSVITLEPGQISRVDTYHPGSHALKLKQVEFEVGTFSDQATQEANTFRFASGDLTQLSVEGLEQCSAAAVADNKDYHTPTGALKTAVRYACGAMTLEKPLQIRSVIRYKAGSYAPYKI